MTGGQSWAALVNPDQEIGSKHPDFARFGSLGADELWKYAGVVDAGQTTRLHVCHRDDFVGRGAHYLEFVPGSRLGVHLPGERGLPVRIASHKSRLGGHYSDQAAQARMVQRPCRLIVFDPPGGSSRRFGSVISSLLIAEIRQKDSASGICVRYWTKP